MPRKVTSFDVARLAGVSQPTVSRVLRNLPGATAETRARVRAAAARLSYLPSDSGRALSTASTRRVAVVADELSNPFYSELVEPLARHLAARDLRLVLVTAAADGDVDAATLADGSYDGVILTTTTRRSSLPRDLSERGVPHVLANRVLDEPEAPSCAVDNTAGARLVANLLAGLGHRRIASIQGPVNTSTGRERAAALQARLRHHRIPLPRSQQRRVAFDHDDGQQAASELLAGGMAPTAIVCGNDVIALGALSAARAMSIEVPDQLSIVGFDDIRPAAWPLVGLTTVRCDLDRLAATAVALLADQLVGGAVVARTVRLPVSLVLRGTHGRASA